MCGYCVEGAVVLDLVERERQGESVAVHNNDVGTCLQETMHLEDYLERIRRASNFPQTPMVIWCRAWDTLIRFDSVTDFRVVAAAFGEECWVDFLASLTIPETYPALAIIQEPWFYRDSSAWLELRQDVKSLTQTAEGMLGDYREWWLSAEDRDSDPSFFSQARNKTPPVEVKRFHREFPWLSMMLTWLIHQKPEVTIIREIALMSPKLAPDFSGYDLWLQRKAFLASLKREGMPFLLKHFAVIRFELMAYALLKGTIAPADYDALAGVVAQSRGCFINYDAQYVLALMERMKGGKVTFGH